MKYKLYAMPCTDENMAFAQKQPYCMINARYILCLSRKKPPVAAAVEDLKILNGYELEWLMECRDDIHAKWLKQNEKALTNNTALFLEEFEKELKAEQTRAAEMGAQE